MDRNLLLLIVGLVAGIIAGGLGFSTAIFLIPALLGLGLLKSYKMTIGTTILTILPPLSFLAFMRYYKEGLVDVHAALLLMLSGFIGGGIGANFAIEDMSGPTLAYAMSGIYAVLAVVWLYLAGTPIVSVSQARRTRT